MNSKLQQFSTSFSHVLTSVFKLTHTLGERQTLTTCPTSEAAVNCVTFIFYKTQSVHPRYGTACHSLPSSIAIGWRFFCIYFLGTMDLSHEWSQRANEVRQGLRYKDVNANIFFVQGAKIFHILRCFTNS